ncbi:MAG: DUF5671 domain-containing protein [bacterium]|nr:DUF5671 domain-containing protein [bacterium]
MDDSQKMRMTPRDFFFQLGITITLYVTAVTLLNLAFSVIDTAFPKVGDYYYGPASISWPVATLIIIFPVYLLLSWFMNKQYAIAPEKKNFGFRKWLMYVTLFITAIALLVDLITVLYYFLDGQDITTGFLLKALAVLIVAGGIFKYYFFDLKGWLTPMKNKLFTLGALMLVIGLIVWGFSVIGSPKTQRLQRIDQVKIDHLQQIQGQILHQYQQKGLLPDTLAELNDPISSFSLPKDPDTNADYTYQKLSALTFKICAVFNTEAKNENMRGNSISMAYPVGYDIRNEYWQHGKGDWCFERKIDPTLYPPTKPEALR